MEKKVNIEIPQELADNIRKELAENKAMKALDKKYAQYLKERNYVLANKTLLEMKAIEDKIIKDHLKRVDAEKIQLKELLDKFSTEDREEMNILCNMMVMMADMIETFSMDMNELLHKYYPECHLEMFENFTKLGMEAKQHMRFVAGQTDIAFQYAFADYADDITALVRNKAKSLNRKLKAIKKKNEKAAKKNGL